MSKLFISHSSKDDNFVNKLRLALEDLKLDIWIDSRELLSGNPLESTLFKAIDAATAFAVVVSAESLRSDWVQKEVRHALKIQRRRESLQKLKGLFLGKSQPKQPPFAIIPLLLDDTSPSDLLKLFPKERIFIPVSSKAGGCEAAVHPILVALGKRQHAETLLTTQPKDLPLEELVLELTDLKFTEIDDKPRATALAELIYEPATPGQERVVSQGSWRLTAPLTPVDTEEIRWYLEKYALWPGDHFKLRADEVEKSLKLWGQSLHKVTFPLEHIGNVRDAWATVPDTAHRRFSVYVNPKIAADAPLAQHEATKAVATTLLCLPWELLHESNSFPFQSTHPLRVRRRLPNTNSVKVPIVDPPIRILLITARPEDDDCRYLDHRASALPLVNAMEQLGGLVELRLLNPPTLPSLSTELTRAKRAGIPYHVVHFDGHGVYDRDKGLGGLCFEDPQDSGKPDNRRHQTVYTNELGPLLSQHRIPLVFLEACQTAQAEQASESVASELLKVGVASVVAMSHSVLVTTASLFVAAFYASLAEGERVGDAMLAGQRCLKDDSFRGHIFGAGELRLADWFVPVLFQEKADPRLFHAIPSPQTRADIKTALKNRLGELPPTPDTGFIGRSRDLLALERLLCGTGFQPVNTLKNGLEAHATPRFAVLRGQGGEGKTALAVEFARWLVRSQQIRRTAFVSVEIHGNAAAVLYALSRQLLPGDTVTATDSDKALLALERALTEQPTLLVIDNMESVLLPPYLADATPEALTEDAARELQAILTLCARLNAVGETRLLFTSREALPAPFADANKLRELRRLDKEDAVKLVERALGVSASIQGTGWDARAAQLDEIEALVDAVQGHARSLALLAGHIRQHGVTATRQSWLALLADMDRRFPGNREQSLYASMELSLRRLSPDNQIKVQALAVFHGGVQLSVLQQMMAWEQQDVAELAQGLIQTGLATANPYNHLSLNPALCLYLRARVPDEDYQALLARWLPAMRDYVEFLVQQSRQKTEIAATLSLLELANLFALLEHTQQAGNAAATIELATSFYRLLQNLGKPRLLARVGQVRDEAANSLGATWSHARFETQRTRTEQFLANGQYPAAFSTATALLQQARAAGSEAYDVAGYDLAMACWLLARVLWTNGNAEPALPLLVESRQGFEAFEQREPGRGAARMASVCLSESGNCLRKLGRLDEATVAFEEGIRQDELQGDERGVAVGKVQLGSVYLDQRRYPEALAAYAEAREQFGRLQESASVAICWHQTGIAHQHVGNLEEAEAAYQQSYSLEMQLGNASGQATTLLQLGNLYDYDLNLPEQAAGLYRQAADIFQQLGYKVNESRAMGNLAITLGKLRHYDEARQAIQEAITCNAGFGHATQTWMAWHILAGIETDSGNLNAATKAKNQAIFSYLAYRRDGGENQDTAGRIAHAVTQALSTGGPTAAINWLQQVLADPEWEPFHPYLNALTAVINGSRDLGLADAPDLDYGMAAEILLLIESLAQASSP